MRCRSRHVAFAVLLGLVAPLSATALTLNFSGTIDQVDDESGISDGSVAVGTPFSGTVTFDEFATDLDSSPNRGSYLYTTPPWTMTVEVGSYLFFTLDAGADPTLAITVEQDEPFDAISISVLNDSVLGPLLNPVSSSSLGPLFLQDVTATALGSDALSLVPFDLTLWPFTQFEFSIEDVESNRFAANGHLDSLTVVPVPEPGSGALLATALALLALRRRRS